MPYDPSTYSTNWSAISRLYGSEHHASWEWFIHRYRSYVAAVLRRRGIPPSELDGATERFWGYLFQSRATQRADRGKRFRSFLSGVVHNFVHQWRREETPNPAPAADFAPEEIADARDEEDLDLWAAQIIYLGLECLGRSHPDDEKILRWFYGVQVDGDIESRIGAREIARRLGRSDNAVHQALFRARIRLRRCLEDEVAMTVTEPPELPEELGLLLAAIDRYHPGLSAPDPEEA